MSKKKRWCLLMAIILIGGCFMIIRYFAIMQVNQTGVCRTEMRTLSDEEIKVRAIKNYFASKLKDENRRPYKIRHFRMAIVDRNITGEDIVEMIKSSTILEFIKNLELSDKTFFATEPYEILSIPDSFFLKDFSVIQYDTKYDRGNSEFVTIINKNGIYLDNIGFKKSRQLFVLSNYEKLNGFGNHFYNFTYYCVNIKYNEAYSDEKTKFKEGELEAIIAQIKERNIAAVEKTEKNKYSFLVVSNCGEVMERYLKEEKWYKRLF